ncbi:TetR family transcriptional regulator [Alcanivorax hongdengensis A-11-3]|uniref:TetR family transcriptional regulator n=1 Tax=Alcanivorax hongdengensis A-11-3 TaxID=1177179 RepID=L0WEM7_9GAMM|nr:TetR/AcrR family transcriptional regulator [Alcanivorax hongdengensis]EKF74612.1 TetR family transcriptional regulator [Alcanivorax hongdengensis A-11-3]
MTQPLTERGRKRYQALLDAAKEIFLEQGYARTTLDMIIARAGGSRRSLYEYFGDKAGLFSAVITAHSRNMVTQIQALDVEQLDAREGLTLLGRTFVDSLISPVNLGLYRLLIAEGLTFPGLGEAIYRNGPQLLVEQLDDFLLSLKAAGKLPHRAITPYTARQFLGMVKGDFHICALLTPEQMPGPQAIDEHITACVDFFLNDR